MGFRGVLLAAQEMAGAIHGFRVVCPDAHLQLPTGGVPRDAPCITEQKLLVTDFVTAELQQVTRVSSVALEQETRSVLWVARVPASGGANGQRLLSGSAYSFDPRDAVAQVCYCFYFRAELEFRMFERAHTASMNLMHYSLLANSLKMELDIQREAKLHPVPTAKAKAKAAAATPVAKAVDHSAPTIAVPVGHEQLQLQRAQLRKELKALKDRGAEHKQAQAIRDQAAALEARRLQAQQQPVQETKRVKDSAASAPKSSLPAVTSASATSDAEPAACVLCGVDADCRGFAGAFVKHPYVLKDGHGSPVMVCKSCLQRILKRRLGRDPGMKSARPKQDSLCGLCADPLEEIKGEVKACAHPQCPRIYCTQCLKKLFGKAQVKKVGRTKQWNCPNCTPSDEPPSLQTKPKASEATHSKEPMTVSIKKEETESSDAGKKTRKRKHEEPAVVHNTKKEQFDVDVQPPKPVADVDVVYARDPITGVVKTLLDYASDYFAFVVQREEQPSPPVESEDVCFCCKDGGDVLECDWTHGSARCHKVYHEDCLGFKVSEEGKWVCPRHRCYKCGFAGQFACRFCVTSFCKEHLPEDVKKLGPTTVMEYVLCAACDDLSLKAVERSKISGDLYNRMLQPEPRKQRKAAKPKKRTR